MRECLLDTKNAEYHDNAGFQYVRQDCNCLSVVFGCWVDILTFVFLMFVGLCDNKKMSYIVIVCVCVRVC